jgi:hypothetical protein
MGFNPIYSLVLEMKQSAVNINRNCFGLHRIRNRLIQDIINSFEDCSILGYNAV